MMTRTKLLAVLLMGGLAAPGPGVATSAAEAGQSPKQPATTVQVSLQVAGVPYAASGNGECIFSDQSSIYDVPGSQWGVRLHNPAGSVNFSMWRLAKGGDMPTLHLTMGGKTHRVNTLQVGPPANRLGSGRATFEKRAAGGVFTVDLVADTGARITGQLTCSRFTRPEENGN